MPFLIGSSLSRGHERSSPDATVSTLHSLPKFPVGLVGAILLVAVVLLGMGGRALAAVTYVATASYSASGEVFEVVGTTGNKTDIHEQDSASVSTNGPSSSVLLALNNKQFSLGGASADVFASAHAGIGALGVDAFASATASTYRDEAGPRRRPMLLFQMSSPSAGRTRKTWASRSSCTPPSISTAGFRIRIPTCSQILIPRVKTS